MRAMVLEEPGSPLRAAELPMPEPGTREVLIRVRFDPKDPRRVLETEELFRDVYGRLRDVVTGPDGALYVATSNRDGRGRPRPGDDRILRVVEAAPVH